MNFTLKIQRLYNCNWWKFVYKKKRKKKKKENAVILIDEYIVSSILHDIVIFIVCCYLFWISFAKKFCIILLFYILKILYRYNLWKFLKANKSKNNLIVICNKFWIIVKETNVLSSYKFKISRWYWNFLNFDFVWRVFLFQKVESHWYIQFNG